MKKILSSKKLFLIIEFTLLAFAFLGFLMQRQGILRETFGICSGSKGMLQTIVYCSEIISKVLFNILGSIAVIYLLIFAVYFMFQTKN